MDIPDRVKAGPVVILWLLAGVFFPPQVARAQATCSQEVAAIEAYCRKVDRLIKANHNSSRRVFIGTALDADHASVGWRESKPDGEEAEASSKENACVWSSQGKIVAVKFTFQSQSGNWVQFATYYYREDGTLAMIGARLNLFRGQTTLLREQFYDRKGVLIRGSVKSCSLKSGREQKPNKELIPEPLPVYLTTDQLPFYQALAEGNAEMRK